MKPVHQLERELDEARKIGIDLHARAEQWRAALEEISRFNRCPVIASIIKKNLHA
jgi:hypothetical protein